MGEPIQQHGPMIGIVGGVGPYAGLDLARKVFDETAAASDQEHLPLAMLSVPEIISDRTEFLLGEAADNPGVAIAEVIGRLERIGATVVGIPCNTAHAPAIFDVIAARLAEANSKVALVHMIEEVGRYLGEHFPHLRRVGVLSTTGTWRAGVYAQGLAPLGIEVIVPDEPLQTRAVHPAIYDPGFGIKARAHPVTARARSLLDEAVAFCRGLGAEAIILGCTELPLAIPEPRIGGMPVIDPTRILARALIREIAPARLR
ncbi:MAG TPA: amino acid racemase [Phycisphaerae bacterium]|nr:amino acid racemase [Phycisphaerae bacterium]